MPRLTGMVTTMPNLSVTVLSPSGGKLRYETYKQSKADVDAGLATWESARCIRMLPDAAGELLDAASEFRPKRSGRDGPFVWQLER